jgi:hypothetical protein
MTFGDFDGDRRRSRLLRREWAVFCLTNWGQNAYIKANLSCVDTSLTNPPYPMPYDVLQPIATIWTSTDGPSFPQLYYGRAALLDANNKGVGWVNYTLTTLTITGGFADWCCIVNGTTTFPASNGWSINVGGEPPSPSSDSSSPPLDQLGQTVTTGGGGGTPITSGITASQYINMPTASPPPTLMYFTR